jgi:hypothetical protein
MVENNTRRFTRSHPSAYKFYNKNDARALFGWLYSGRFDQIAKFAAPADKNMAASNINKNSMYFQKTCLRVEINCFLVTVIYFKTLVFDSPTVTKDYSAVEQVCSVGNLLKLKTVDFRQKPPVLEGLRPRNQVRWPLEISRRHSHIIKL